MSQFSLANVHDVFRGVCTEVYVEVFVDELLERNRITYRHFESTPFGLFRGVSVLKHLGVPIFFYFVPLVAPPPFQLHFFFTFRSRTISDLPQNLTGGLPSRA